MAKETLREKFERETGVKALNKTGAKTKQYSDYLLSPEHCSVPWMSNWANIYKKNKDTPYETGDQLLKDLAEVDKKNRLEEKCSRGGAGTGELLKSIAQFRRESLEKYGIKGF